MTGKRPLFIGIGIGLIISSMLLTIISISGKYDPAIAQKTQQNTLTQQNGQENAQQNSRQNLEGNKDIESNVEINDSQKLKNQDTTDTNQISKDYTTITIPPGSTAQIIAAILLNQDLIANEAEFLDIVEARNVAGKFQAGEFKLEKNQEVNKIIDRLAVRNSQKN